MVPTLMELAGQWKEVFDALPVYRASLVAQMVKSLPAMWETWVQSLGWEDPMEKEIPHQYSCLENPTDKGDRQATVHGVAKS